MNELNRNTRTLIVSFVLVIMMLIPLRFVEVGEGLSVSENQMVLGETSVNQPVVTEVVEPSVPLEEPYQTIENKFDCIAKTDIDAAWNDLRVEIENKQVDQAQATEVVNNLILAQTRVCK